MFKHRRKLASFFSLITLASFSAPAMAAVSYAGSWHAYFDGGNTGTCQVSISPSGAISGNCKGNLPPFQVKGSISGDNVHFGVASTGAKFSGVMVSGKHGIGHWQNGANSGAWYILKN
ncbi:MAG: hypothetical protein ACYDCF_08715 [Burkholderiales bacterium]